MSKILVIEDMKSLREDIVEILECLQFEAISAENGAVGLKRAQQELPDLIICDIMMPEMDGFEVFNALNQTPKTAAIPFIFLSAKADKSDIRQGMNLGADDYLTKPFSIADLQQAITARLKKKSAIAQSYICEHQPSEERINLLYRRDPLTNLPNRTLLRERLEKAIIEFQETQKLFAIVCLDLNRFQVINATLGYTIGDLLLQAVAIRLNQFINNENTIARTGEDEFTILLVDIAQKQDVYNFAEAVLKELSQVYILNEHKVRIQVSVGIAFYPEDGINVEKLLNNAEIARRGAKERGGSNYQFYHPQMNIISAESQAIESNLILALEQSEFKIYYQPQIDLSTGRVTGAEALIRWHHPELGIISPAKFIPLAEETGLIIPIGEWVLRTACRQMQTWHSSGLLPIKISVNLSACQFKQRNLKKIITNILAETGLNPNFLELELTETSVMQNVEAAIHTLHELKDMGICISIDDFGIGYSSLSYLKRFPINTLKIDRAFVKDINKNENEAAIAKAIITMAQSLQLKVIAEGVETQAQLNFLKQHGCNAIQGYLFSPAVPAEKFEQFLLENKQL